MNPQREWFEKDYYETSRCVEDGIRQGDQEGVPQARQ